MTPLSLTLFGSVSTARGKLIVRKRPAAGALPFACAAAAPAAEPSAKIGAIVTAHHNIARLTIASGRYETWHMRLTGQTNPRDLTPTKPQESISRRMEH